MLLLTHLLQLKLTAFRNFPQKGIEVLLLSDRVDEWMMSHLTEFGEKQFQSITRGDLDLGKLDDEETKKHKKSLKRSCRFS